MGSQKLKSWTFRIPELVLDFLRETAAKRSIKEKRRVSLNEVAVQILQSAIEMGEERKGSKLRY